MSYVKPNPKKGGRFDDIIIRGTLFCPKEQDALEVASVSSIRDNQASLNMILFNYDR